MKVERALGDLARLQSSIRKVMAAAKVESLAMHRVADSCTEETVAALHDTHLTELDAIQALAASLALFERHLPEIRDALERSVEVP